MINKPKSKHPLKAQRDGTSAVTPPNPFRVCAEYRYGINGPLLCVSIIERIDGTSDEALSTIFVVDLQSVPALQQELDRVFDKATKDGLFNNDNDDHGRRQRQGGNNGLV